MPSPPPASLTPAFGAVIKELRTSRGMSQWELSDAAGVHRNTPGLIERGERVPSLDTIQAFARAFDMEAWELVREAESRVNGPPR